MIINILHLYPELPDLYGEYGNLIILKKHIEDQGYEVKIDKVNLDDTLELANYDFVYIGYKAEKNNKKVLMNLKKHTSNIRDYIESKGVFLATGSATDLFGKRINKEEGLGIFDFESIKSLNRISSNVIYKSLDNDFSVVGTINKTTEIYHNFQPLFRVVEGVGENKKNDYEGTKYLNFYGTHVIGPILSKNPDFTKMIVTSILKNDNDKFEYAEKKYEFEEACFAELKNKAKKSEK